MASARYREGMTVLIPIGVFAALITTVVLYVVWRDRRSRRSFVDPSVSRAALVQADRQKVQGLLASTGMPVTTFLGQASQVRFQTDRP